MPEHPFLAEHLPFVAMDHDLSKDIDYSLEELFDLMMTSRSLSHEADGVRLLVDAVCVTHLFPPCHE